MKKIEVLGTGCPACKKFFSTVQEVAKDLEITDEIIYNDDVAKMVEIGIMTSPALVVDNKPVLLGSGHSEKEIREVLLKACFGDAEKVKEGGCSGCSGCSGC